MLMRTLFSCLYALLLLSLSGIMSTVEAVVSCHDTITTATTYRYSDALMMFTGYHGKTYAIARSAVSGSQAQPDSYFNFSADISREYGMTGVDSVSLKRMLELGQYGAARPVRIDNQQTLDFLLKRYGSYLGAATSARSSYVDAWKEFGAGGFTFLDGTALTFNNWAATGPTAGSGPQAVVMGNDGVWINGLDGGRSAQIVEFPGTLDCATAYIDPSTITPPPPPPEPPPPDPNAISNIMCGQDLNLNGYAADPGEVANCIQTAQGQFCPVGATECVESYTAPVCPAGSTLETTRDMCQATSQNVCGSGYSWDSTIDKCTKAVVCPDAGVFNPVTDRCEKLVQNECPVGYVYDANLASPTYDSCVKPATCADGGVYSAANDRCEKAWTPSCDSVNGYVYNPLSGLCQRQPVCTSGTYSASYDLCTKPLTTSCPAGYALNATTGRCEMSPVCPVGTTFNAIANRCEVPATVIDGYTQPLAGRTEIIKYKGRGDTSTGITQYSATPLALDSFSFDFILQNGQVVLKSECAWGGSGNCGCDRPHWNGWCRAGTDLVQTRTGDTLTVEAKIFDWSGYSCCAEGYQIVSSYNPDSGYYDYCQSDTGSPGTCYDVDGYAYDCTVYSTVSVDTCYQKSYTTGAAASADLSEFVACPSGYTATTPPDASKCLTITTQWGNQTGIVDCTQAGLYTCSAPVTACTAGFTLDGTSCYQNPTCPSGSFDYNRHTCFAPTLTTCDDNFTLDSGSGLCFKAPACPLGVLNGITDRCEIAVTRDCGTYSLDAVTNLCTSSPVCANGAYDTLHNVCQATLTRNCGAYSWSQPDLKCLQPIACPKDPAFSQAATTTYSPALDHCVSATQHDCPTGTTYTPLPIGKCEAVPVCSGAGIYNPQKDSCFEGVNTCPLGSAYACMEYQGKKRCSPNPCFDPSTPGAEETTTLDESMLQDDGQRDDNGQCLGQLFIFNGKASRCRPPGLKVGMINNCCKSDKVSSEDTGTSIQAAVQGIQMAYEIGQVAYYGNALVTGAAQISAISTTATGAVTSMTVVTATGTTTTLSGAAATGAYASMASGATGASAMSAGIQAYASALLNPATIAVAIVIMVVMKVLMGSGCDQGDIQTGMQNAAKDCHYVGDYCEKRWPLVGCVQQAKSFCCFNSKMARIIHEQGRPQLQAFQPNGAWGVPELPNCRGFTPDEFQALDFSRIDLSEYFDDVQKDLSTKIDGSQQTIMQNIQNKYQATPK